jgi:hypothetical protein
LNDLLNHKSPLHPLTNPTMVLEPASSTLITETDAETETIPKPCSAQTEDPVYRLKPTSRILTPLPIENTPSKKQCIIYDFYSPNSWYNTPATTHNYQSLTTKESQPFPIALNNSLSTTLTFNLLCNNAYVKLSTDLLASTSLSISATALAVADTLLDRAQTIQSDDEPTAKRQKLQILHHDKYRTIEAQIKMVRRYTQLVLVLFLIDSTLQIHRANKRAAAIINLTSDAKPKPATTCHNAGKIIPPSPPIKEESPTKPASSPTPGPASTKQPSTVQTYKWSPTPTAKLNTHIHDNLFLKTIATEYPGATATIALTCAYNTNPQATLTAALHILGTKLPVDVLQPMFQ